MNDEDQLENRLRRVPQQSIPPGWRNEILGAARRAAAGHQPVVAPRASWLDGARARLAELLWPHPRAWAGLAAAWVVVLGLNLANRDSRPVEWAQQAVRPSPEVRELLHEQGQLLAELVDRSKAGEPSHSRPALPQPRSQRRETFVNT